MKQKAKLGDTIQVHYTGYHEDGSVFDSSKSEKTPPFEFTLGSNDIIPGFENACINMQVGENKTVTISAENGYGPSHKELISSINLSLVPKDIKPEVGLEVKIGPEDNPTYAMITQITEDTITLDANHPLAGKTLRFDIDLVEIK